MAPSRASTSQASNINSVYTLSLLSEYNHTLDSLPLDLSRNFADLRELDAVLSSSIASITMKIQRLTQVVEEGSMSKQERLMLLTAIADEATRLKLGGEDKIRVACQAADNLKGHTNHMRTLLSLIPSFDMSALDRKTTYPHISTRSYMPIPENSRRKRGNYGSIMTTAQDVSPAKRKRIHRDDDIDVVGGKSPRKEKTGEAGASRSRNGARSRKPERAPSPAESILSVTSHTVLPIAQPYANSSRAAGSTSRSANTANRRSKTQVVPQAYDDPIPNGSTSRRDIFPGPPASSTGHPSLPLPYGNGSNGLHNYDISTSHVMTTDWAGPPLHGQLEGPGMPVARNAHTGMSIGPAGVLTPNLPLGHANDAPSVAADTATEIGDGDGDGDGEGDDRRYCFCNGVSYGEMIACDDENCEREWFHITCIGLTVPPQGSWFCEACRAKQRNAKRGARSNKKRVGGGGARSGGKAANNS
ncbi:hypothetical protein F5I97DRAFT_1878570 [Phlebopus sp. FC_14]|nr:hypothetical protein F5I97DRAFT_1878570 [Phlebopus sp. FC_14]